MGDWQATVCAAVVLAALALWTPACVSQRDAVIATLNHASVAGDLWLELVQSRYRDELDAIVASDAAPEAKELAVRHLAESYRPAFASYRAFRAAWLSAAGALEAGDGARLVEALALLQQCAAELERAEAALGGEVE